MNIYACNPDFLRDYLYKINSLSSDDRLSAFAKRSARSQNSILSVDGNVATLTIRGVLRDGPSVFADFMGFSYTTYATLLDAIDQISSDKDIEKVVLDIDSPGGYVAPGIDQTWEALFALRKQGKEIIAVNSGMMASGAYWIASAADQIVSIHELTQQGSIGVYQAFIDWTGNDKKNGIKEVRVVSKNAPLKNLPTDDPKLVEQIQEDLDYIEKLFLARISEGRGKPVKEIIENFGQGALVLTDRAVEVGMLDGILPSKSNSSAVDNSVGAVEEPKQETGECHMRLSELMTSEPSIKAEVEEIRQSAYDEGFKAATDKINERVKIASNFVANENYNEHIHNLARGVLAGEASVETLQSVVAFFDQDKVKKELQKAQEQSSKVETGVAENPDIVGSTYEQDGVIRTQEDLEKRHARA